MPLSYRGVSLQKINFKVLVSIVQLSTAAFGQATMATKTRISKRSTNRMSPYIIKINCFSKVLARRKQQRFRYCLRSRGDAMVLVRVPLCIFILSDRIIRQNDRMKKKSYNATSKGRGAFDFSIPLWQPSLLLPVTADKRESTVGSTSCSVVECHRIHLWGSTQVEVQNVWLVHWLDRALTV